MIKHKIFTTLAISAFVSSAANAVPIYVDGTSQIDLKGTFLLSLDKSGSTSPRHMALNNQIDTKFRMNYALGNDYNLSTIFKINSYNGYFYPSQFPNVILRKRDVGALIVGSYSPFITVDSEITDDDLNLYTFDYSGDPLVNYIPGNSTSDLSLSYEGIPNFRFSARYKFSNKSTFMTNGFQLGALYGDSNTLGLIAGFLYGHTNYTKDKVYGISGERVQAYTLDDNKPPKPKLKGAYYVRDNEQVIDVRKNYKDGVLAKLGYVFDDGSNISFNAGYGVRKGYEAKYNSFYLSPNFDFMITSKASLYGGYKYAKLRTESISRGRKLYQFINNKRITDKDGKEINLKDIFETNTFKAERSNGFFLGVEYDFDTKVKVFLEGKYEIRKGYSRTYTTATAIAPKGKTEYKDINERVKGITMGLRIDF